MGVQGRLIVARHPSCSLSICSRSPCPPLTPPMSPTHHPPLSATPPGGRARPPRGHFPRQVPLPHLPHPLHRRLAPPTPQHPFSNQHPQHPQPAQPGQLGHHALGGPPQHSRVHSVDATLRLELLRSVPAPPGIPRHLLWHWHLLWHHILWHHLLWRQLLRGPGRGIVPGVFFLLPRQPRRLHPPPQRRPRLTHRHPQLPRPGRRADGPRQRRGRTCARRQRTAKPPAAPAYAAPARHSRRGERPRTGPRPPPQPGPAAQPLAGSAPRHDWRASRARVLCSRGPVPRHPLRCARSSALPTATTPRPTTTRATRAAHATPVGRGKGECKRRCPCVGACLGGRGWG